MAASMSRVIHVLEANGQYRYLLRHHLNSVTAACNVTSIRSYGSDSEDKDSPSKDEGKMGSGTKNEEQLSPKQVAALEKLNSLMKTMKVSRHVDGRLKSTLDLAKPTHQLERRLEKEEQKRQQVESEQKEAEVSDTPVEDGKIDPAILHAVKDVATSLGGDFRTTESELLAKLREHGRQGASPAEKVNLSNVFVNMKIEQSKKTPEPRQYPVSPRLFESVDPRGRASPSDIQGMKMSPAKVRLQTRPRTRTKVDIFGSGTLNIFSLSDFAREDKHDFPKLKLWDRLEENELQLKITHPPKNAYEEMIRWTEQNKFWKFPIDNEIGLEEESKVSFHEHIFLDHLLEEGFPKKGPVRHFMELVTTGLSKNPYLTVQQKHDHVAWFRDYFKEKEDILKAVGAA